ncbi:MAG TPA: hypothetical protein VK145_00880 [Candidatus Nanoarchaeia archaeon]|nr:hypothetical protein [Candidatus Nanoarchaeia archaeon]
MVSWWHGLTQGQRNDEILSVALDQNGDHTGLQCKHWVQEVVDEASRGEVYPPTNQNDYTWRSSSNVRVMQKPFPIQWAQPGQIIQMRWKNRNGSTYPHTAILKSKTSTKMYWVDCNWHGDETVDVHSVTYSDFNRAVGNYYNVYEIK